MNPKNYPLGVLLLGLGSLAVAAAAVLTHYPGLIELKVETQHGSGQVTIDGRTLERPALPPRK